MHRKLASLIIVGAFALAGCGGGDAGAGASPAATEEGTYPLVSAGKLTVCTHLAYKPFQFADDTGRVVGFDVDVMDLVAQQMGVTQEIVDVPFDQIWSGAALAAGKCDLGAAGITITEERAGQVTFSDPYFDATQALLVKKGSGITNLAQMSGRNLGVQTDTTGQKYSEEHRESNGYTIVVFEDLPTSVNGVKSGRVDGAVNDNGVLYDFAKDNPDTEVVAEFHTGEQYGIAAKKDADGDALLAVVNETLTQARSDGRYDEIYAKWFGTVPGVTEEGVQSTQPAAEGTGGQDQTADQTGQPGQTDTPDETGQTGMPGATGATDAPEATMTDEPTQPVATS